MDMFNEKVELEEDLLRERMSASREFMLLT